MKALHCVWDFGALPIKYCQYKSWDIKHTENLFYLTTLYGWGPKHKKCFIFHSRHLKHVISSKIVFVSKL